MTPFNETRHVQTEITFQKLKRKNSTHINFILWIVLKFCLFIVYLWFTRKMWNRITDNIKSISTLFLWWIKVDKICRTMVTWLTRYVNFTRFCWWSWISWHEKTRINHRNRLQNKYWLSKANLLIEKIQL